MEITVKMEMADGVHRLALAKVDDHGDENAKHYV
jgi:hypothetical protein